MQTVPETLYAESKMIAKGILPKPRACFFTPTYHCNQSCYYCFYKKWNDNNTIEPTGNIPGIFKQLKELGVQSIEFEGGGDPLMTPKIADIFESASSMGFRLGLLTNGALFKDKIAETFIKHGTYVRFSIETVDKELYKKIRGTYEFETVAENIRKAIDIKRELRSDCDISIKIGLPEEIGYKEILDVYDYFKDFGLTNIQVKNLWNEEGFHYRKDITKSELSRIEVIKTKVVKKVVYPKFMTEPCWLTPIQIAIDIHGDFYLCAYYMYRKKSFKVGNIFETPLKELWGSDRHKEVIKNVKINECLIHDCRFQKYIRVINRRMKDGKWEFV